jgi:hypothetical protein
VHDRQGPAKIDEKDGARLERGDEKRLRAVVVRGDEAAELGDAGRDLRAGEVDLSDRAVRGRLYEASFSWYR